VLCDSDARECLLAVTVRGGGLQLVCPSTSAFSWSSKLPAWTLLTAAKLRPMRCGVVSCARSSVLRVFVCTCACVRARQRSPVLRRENALKEVCAKRGVAIVDGNVVPVEDLDEWTLSAVTAGVRS
jgi:hypothetical protein